MKLFVKEVRKKSGMTVRELESRSGVSKSQIQKLEEGVVDPKLSTICKIAKGLRVSPCDLFSCK